MADEAVAGAAPAEDAGAKAKTKAKEISLPKRIHTWPYLVRLEFMAALIVMTVMTAWSIAIDAPLEEPANPNRTPNPSKAPWYFLGLQEMLVYFDPWMAGVVLPSLIIVGLMIIPYIDTNTRGNGYYTVKERPFAISTFLFGFLILWILLIFLGTFMRGPGWYFFWPGQYWDPHKTVALTNVDFPYLVGARSYWTQFIIGALATGAVFGWFVPLIPLLSKKELPGFMKSLPGMGWMHKQFQEQGLVRWVITWSLMATMIALPVKMILRWTLNVKYLWVTPWFNI
jgi:hypothetical protein